MCCELTSMYELINGYVVSSRYMTKSVKIVDLLSMLTTLLCVKDKRAKFASMHQGSQMMFFRKKRANRFVRLRINTMVVRLVKLLEMAPIIAHGHD